MPASEPKDLPSNQPTIDELFDVMGDETRRRVLHYLCERGSADVDELQEHLSEQTTADAAEIRLSLYHKALPKLADLEIIEYDQHSEQVRYNGGSLMTELLEWIGDKERKDS